MFEAYREGTWLVAVSAGCDSMALLDMAAIAGVQVAVAHVNYHHQVQAEEEEAYMRSFCAARGFVLHVASARIANSGNFEAQARQFRYSFFAKVVREHGYVGVLVAHHQDDRLETYIMQKEKGLVPSVYGLAESVMIEGVRVDRPLLGYTRVQLEEYCRSAGIRWFEDETNRDLSYARNRVRHLRLSAMGEDERRELILEMEQANVELAQVRKEAELAVQDGKVALRVYRALGEKVRLCVVYQLVQRHITLAYAQQIDHVLCTKGDVCIPFGESQLVQENGYVFLMDTPKPYHLVFSTLQEVPIGLSSRCFALVSPHPGVSAVTVREEDFPLVLRCARSGDHILMRFGEKKVNRFFIDRHIPRYMRAFWPVLENAQGQVIFVAGLGCDVHHHAVSPSFSVLQCLHYMEDLGNE